MATNVPLLIGADGAVDALRNFTVSPIRRRYRVDMVQAAFGTSFTEFGERTPEALTVTLSGPIFAPTAVDYRIERDRIYRLITRRNQWLRVNERQVPVGSLTNDEQTWEDLFGGKVDTFEFELNILSPFWEDLETVVTTQNPAVGTETAEKLFTVQTSGTAPTYPLISFSANNMHAFEVVVNGRTLRWFNFNSAGSKVYANTLVRLDYLGGLVRATINGVDTDIRKGLTPDSQFAPFNPGPFANSVRIKVAGTSPITLDQIQVTHTERYY